MFADDATGAGFFSLIEKWKPGPARQRSAVLER
jgi:hypothetical protein